LGSAFLIQRTRQVKQNFCAGAGARQRSSRSVTGRWRAGFDSSQLLYEVAHTYFERAGDLKQGADRDVEVPTLDLTDEVVVKVRRLGEFLLRQTSLPASSANFFAQQTTMAWFGTHET
jgi:hypothetical protein